MAEIQGVPMINLCLEIRVPEPDFDQLQKRKRDINGTNET